MRFSSFSSPPRPARGPGRPAGAGLARVFLLGATVTGLSLPSHASSIDLQGPPPPAPPEVVSRDEQARVTVRAVRLPEPLTLDGRPTEGIYSRVPAVSGFVQQEPREDTPATEPTDVWIFFDEEQVHKAVSILVVTVSVGKER